MSHWIAVFTATVIADVFWAQWSLAVAEKRAYPAATNAALIILCSGFTIVEYTADHWLLIPAAIGAYAGTFFTVKWS